MSRCVSNRFNAQRGVENYPTTQEGKKKDFLCQNQINTDLKTYNSAVMLDDIFRKFYELVLWMYKGSEYSVASVDLLLTSPLCYIFILHPSISTVDIYIYIYIYI